MNEKATEFILSTEQTVKAYVCPACGKAYPRQSYPDRSAQRLDAHMRMAHGYNIHENKFELGKDRQNWKDINIHDEGPVDSMCCS